MADIDNGANTVSTDGTDNRSLMLASALAIASAIVTSENKLSGTAKEWGLSLFRAVYREGANLDALIGDSKIAAGWKTLTLSDAGKKAKGRLEVYFSNARLVAERFGNMSLEERTAILDGVTSVHYVAEAFRKADREAKKAERKAAEAANEAADEANDTTPPKPDLSGFTLAELAEAMLNRYQLADNDEKSEAHPALALIVEAMNADIEADVSALAEEPVALAA
jgi:hypothetical protein